MGRKRTVGEKIYEVKNREGVGRERESRDRKNSRHGNGKEEGGRKVS